MLTLDDATEAFCQKFGGGGSFAVPSLRMEMPVPTAQQGSRGANMISTLKYGLLKQTLLMGFSVMVVDLDIIFLKDPFLHLYRDAGLNPNPGASPRPNPSPSPSPSPKPNLPHTSTATQT